MSDSHRKKRSSTKYKLLGILLLLLLSGYYLGGGGAREHGETVEQEPLTGENTVKSIMPAGSVLWKLGSHDGSAGEFKGKGNTEAVAVSSNKQSGPSPSGIPAGLNGKSQPELKIGYDLKEVPQNGVLFRVSILEAYKNVPQMAVFSNRQLSGIIQLAGVSGTGVEQPFRKTYELYIPKEQLQTGQNELRLEAVRCLYCSAAEDQFNWWTWDDLSLEALSTPAPEPVHGNYVLTGTTINNKQFYFDEGAVKHLPYLIKWLGLAYSGNIMRTNCASDVGRSCSNMEEYYKVLQDYNMQSVALYLYTGDIKLDADGSLPKEAEAKLEDYFKKYGSYFQYYEVDNEPGLFNRSKAVNLAIADWLNKRGKQLSPELQTVAPGWAYWPSYKDDSCGNQKGSVRKCGDPDGWERDPKQRLELEEATDLTNGHSYGESYIFRGGGSFTENLKTFSGAANGLPKKMLSTEFGTSDSHVDDYRYGADQRNAAVFDRIMRAHIGYADMFVQHAAFFKDYSLFEYGFNLEEHDPAKTKVYYITKDQESRVSIMRRLALAYATHGAPLTYEVSNKAELADKLVYVRAVDTSTLKPLPVTGAESNKVLVNLVNFEDTEQRITVKVKMPKQEVYEGERYGRGDTYEEARSYVKGQAAGEMTFTETLAPGEGVQFILQPSSEVTGEAPQQLTAAAVKGPGVSLNWLEVTGNGYEVLRADGPDADLRVIASGVQQTGYIDKSVRESTDYTYAVRVTGSKELSNPVTITATGLVPLERSGWKISANVNEQGANPASAIDGDRRTRWDSGRHQKGGEALRVDLGRTHRIEQVTLDNTISAYDYPRVYEVQVSTDGTNWTTAASGVNRNKQERTIIRFNPVTARYVRIMQNGSGGNYWSVHELYIYSRD